MGFVLIGMLAATAWATVDTVAGRVLLGVGAITLAGSLLRGRRAR